MDDDFKKTTKRGGGHNEEKEPESSHQKKKGSVNVSEKVLNSNQVSPLHLIMSKSENAHMHEKLLIAICISGVSV